jgi:hypothetical protein
MPATASGAPSSALNGEDDKPKFRRHKTPSKPIDGYLNEIVRQPDQLKQTKYERSS